MVVRIYGFGWVGRAMKELFPDALISDPKAGYNHTSIKADIAFVCVPTPNLKDGSLDTSIVEGIVASAQEDLLVIRSTVNPGTCDSLAEKYNKRIVMQPEYLGETPNHPMLDQHSRPFLVLGGSPSDRRAVVDLYTQTYNANVSIRQVSNVEAEVIKLTENRAIAYKVSQCQELYDACEAAGVDYYTIRDAVYGDDPRFDLWWTFIYPDKRGFSSKCIPKDVYGWAAWTESLGFYPELTRALLKYNDKLINAVDNNS